MLGDVLCDADQASVQLPPAALSSSLIASLCLAWGTQGCCKKSRNSHGAVLIAAIYPSSLLLLCPAHRSSNLGKDSHYDLEHELRSLQALQPDVLPPFPAQQFPFFDASTQTVALVLNFTLTPDQAANAYNIGSWLQALLAVAQDSLALALNVGCGMLPPTLAATSKFHSMLTGSTIYLPAFYLCMLWLG